MIGQRVSKKSSAEGEETRREREKHEELDALSRKKGLDTIPTTWPG